MKTICWIVHAYTATGGLLTFWSLIEVYQGNLYGAFIILFFAKFIDYTDGFFARLFRVKERIPWYDGARLDDAIDVFGYVYVPVFIIWSLKLVHPLVLAIPILSSLFVYGLKEMKTKDDFFLGWPTLWDLVALYLYWLRPGVTVSTLMIVFFGILNVVPIRYLYPSKNRHFQKSLLGLGVIWAGMIFVFLIQENPNRTGILASLFYPIYYLIVSWYNEVKLRLDKYNFEI